MISIGYAQAIIYFALYSFVGWVMETIICSIQSKRFVNRGFLFGPWCPIYGVGVLLILMITQSFVQYPALVFLVALLSTTALEYFTGWLMERLFQMRWWDYSDRKFNINGYVCLLNSLAFGALGVLVVYFAHPIAQQLVVPLSNTAQQLIASVLVAIFIIDLMMTLNAMVGVREKLIQLSENAEQAIQRSKEGAEQAIQRSREMVQDGAKSLTESAEQAVQRGKERVSDIAESAEQALQRSMEMVQDGTKALTESAEQVVQRGKERVTSIAEDAERAIQYGKERIASIAESAEQIPHRGKGAQPAQVEGTERIRYLRAYPHMHAVGEKPARVFQHAGFYRMFWVFVVASVIGYVLETLFCLAASGEITSRQGLLYGPFNQIYGFGAILMAWVLPKFRKWGDHWLFIGGALLGGAFEFACSYIQEWAFNSVSWAYDDQVMSIGGRTSLMYMFFWGLLGYVFIKNILPWLTRMINQIPRRQSIFFSWVLIVLLCANMFLSATAVLRWYERDVIDAAPSTEFEQYLDRHYPDSRMMEVYPSMIWRSDQVEHAAQAE